MLTSAWKKSRRSGPNCDNCVEVRLNGDTIEVRDTKDRDGGTLKFTGDEWRAFVAGAKDSEFDI